VFVISPSFRPSIIVYDMASEDEHKMVVEQEPTGVPLGPAQSHSSNDDSVLTDGSKLAVSSPMQDTSS
jgi:hypothetical protein